MKPQVGATYFSTEKRRLPARQLKDGWQKGYNRTDDPLGADIGKLFSTEGLLCLCGFLELAGDYRTEFLPLGRT